MAPKITVPKTYQPPVKGAPRESLAYLSETEKLLLASHPKSKAHRTKYGIESFALDQDDKDDMSGNVSTGNWNGAPNSTSGDTSNNGANGDGGSDGPTSTGTQASSPETAAANNAASAATTAVGPTGSPTAAQNNSPPASLGGIGSLSSGPTDTPDPAKSTPNLSSPGGVNSLTSPSTGLDNAKAASDMVASIDRKAPTVAPGGDNLSLNKNVGNAPTNVDIGGLSQTKGDRAKELAGTFKSDKSMLGGAGINPTSPDPKPFNDKHFEDHWTDKVADFFGATPEATRVAGATITGEQKPGAYKTQTGETNLERDMIGRTMANRMARTGSTLQTANTKTNVLGDYDANGIQHPEVKTGTFKQAMQGGPSYRAGLESMLDAVNPDSQLNTSLTEDQLASDHYAEKSFVASKAGTGHWTQANKPSRVSLGSHVFSDPNKVGQKTQMAMADEYGQPYTGTPDAAAALGRPDTPAGKGDLSDEPAQMAIAERATPVTGINTLMDAPDAPEVPISKPEGQPYGAFEKPEQIGPAKGQPYGSFKQEAPEEQIGEWEDVPDEMFEAPEEETAPEVPKREYSQPVKAGIESIKDKLAKGEISLAQAKDEFDRLTGGKWDAGVSKKSIPSGYETEKLSMGIMSGYVGVDPSVLNQTTTTPTPKPSVSPSQSVRNPTPKNPNDGLGVMGLGKQITDRLGGPDEAREQDTMTDGTTTTAYQSGPVSENPMQDGDVSEEDQAKLDHIHSGKKPPTSAAGAVAGAVVGVAGTAAGLPGAGVGGRAVKNRVDAFQGLPSYAQRGLMADNADARARGMPASSNNGAQSDTIARMEELWAAGANIPDPGDPLYTFYEAWLIRTGQG